MNRRGFLSNLFKATVTIAVAPAIVSLAEEVKPKPHIIVLDKNGKEYWIDKEMWEAERRFMQELEYKFFYGTRRK